MGAQEYLGGEEKRGGRVGLERDRNGEMTTSEKQS